MKNALFFDIDGTLINSKGEIPKSAFDAIQKTREQGNLVFINSGRCMAMLEFIDDLMPVDGYLAGCGTEIIYHGQRIFYHRMPEEDKDELKTAADKYNVELIIEGTGGVYYHTAVEDSRFPVMAEVQRVTRQSGCGFYEKDDTYEASKFCFQADEDSDVDGIIEQFGDRYDIVDRHGGFFEASPAGMNKGSAIDAILEKLGIDKKHAYVFGDSTNDLTMFTSGAVTVAMKKHDPELEEFADFITTDIEDDGIKNAMEHFKLI